jgi:acetyltransferase-like isoleucine patch superfamily enzyme
MKKQSRWSYLFNRARTTPHLILPGFAALLNGYWHKFKFLILGKRVKIGKWFRVYGKFYIIGCGKLIIGDNCFIQSKLFKPVSFLTVLPEAQIIIGDNVGFSGTTVQCYQQISIGDWCNIADAYLVDSPAHGLSADRRTIPDHEIPSAPVQIERNVWISTRVVVCHGVAIGENSVVGACSLVRSNIAANSFYAGNPAKFIKPLPEAGVRRIDDLL